MTESAGRTQPTVAQFRHRREVPMLIMGGVLSLVALVVAGVLLAGGNDLPDWLNTAVLLVILGPLIAAVFSIRWGYWSVIANAVEITPRQLPEIYALYEGLAHDMGMVDGDEGMDAVPRLYVVNGNGLLNAYASKCRLSRAYVVIYSDLLDIAFEHDDLTTVRFALAHELGHVKCRHVSVWRQLLRPVAKVLFLADSITRSQEYTADRVASYYAPEGAMGLAVLLAGKRVYRRIDLDAYFESVASHPDGFWLRLANFKANHAVGFHRMSALRRIETEGWDVHGRML